MIENLDADDAARLNKFSSRPDVRLRGPRVSAGVRMRHDGRGVSGSRCGIGSLTDRQLNGEERSPEKTEERETLREFRAEQAESKQSMQLFWLTKEVAVLIDRRLPSAVNFLQVLLLGVSGLASALARGEEPFSRLPLALQPSPDTAAPVVRSNLTYQASDGVEWKLDAYFPADLGPNSVRPAVLFIHGDADEASIRDAKDWRCFRDYGRLAAAHGLIGITFNHSSTQEGRRLLQADANITNALHFVREQAGLLHVDPEKIGAWCFSGGGLHLSLFLRHPGLRISAIVGYYPALYPDPRFIGPEEQRTFAAMYHLSGDPSTAPPMFIVRCGQDSPFVNYPLDVFWHEAVAKNFELELVALRNAPHAFDVLEPNESSRQVVRRSFEWLAARLR